MFCLFLCSVGALCDALEELREVLAAVGELCAVLPRLLVVVPGLAAAFFEAEQADVGGFRLGGVFAGGFAEGGAVGAGVEDVVADLVEQAEVLA